MRIENKDLVHSYLLLFCMLSVVTVYIPTIGLLGSNQLTVYSIVREA